MKEKLESIYEQISILKKEREEIERKSYITKEDKETLSIIKELEQELYYEVNNLPFNEQIINVNLNELEFSETPRTKFEKNKKAIDEIVYESKKLQPKFTSSQKKYKKDILKRLGFIETVTPDDRKIMIHPSLVGKYYDLVKSQKEVYKDLKKEYLKEKLQEKHEEKKNNNEPLTVQITKNEKNNIISEEENSNEIEENEVPLKKQIENIKEQLKEILYEKKGKKMFVKYDKQKYYLPKNQKGKFLALMYQLNILEKKEKIENYITQISEGNLSKEEQNNLYVKAVEIQTKTLTSQEKEDAKKIMPSTDENTRNQSYAGVKVAQMLGGYNPEIQKDLEINQTHKNNDEKNYQELKTKDNILSTTKDTKEYINEENQDIIKERKERYERIKPHLKQTALEQAKLLTKEQEENKNEIKITNTRRPSKLQKIKRKLKIGIAIAIATITLITGINISKNSKKDQNISSPTSTQKQESTQDTSSTKKSNTEKINKYLSELINQEKSHDQEVKEDNESLLTIGKTVNIANGAKIYKTAKDSLLEENPYRPYYNNYNEKRTILGLSVEYNNQIVNVFACENNNKEKINNLLNNGGKIKSLLLGNREQDLYLKNYKGEQLTVDDINEKAEGWYSINDIEIESKGKGYNK